MKAFLLFSLCFASAHNTQNDFVACGAYPRSFLLSLHSSSLFAHTRALERRPRKGPAQFVCGASVG